MMKQRIPYSVLSVILVGASLLALSGCGDTFDTADLGATSPENNFGDTTYVLQQPVWDGFDRPGDIHVGHEPFLYVVETGGNRITMLDLAGTRIGSSSKIRNPVAMSQDYRLNLLICAEFDTTIDGRAVTFGAIYKIDLFAAGHNLPAAPVHRVFFDSLNTNRRYTGISILGDNSYYVTRTGPNNNSIIDPDDAVMLFDSGDNLRPRVEWPGLSVDGTGLATITKPTSITTFPRTTNDFIFTQKGEKSYFRTQWITQRTTGDITQWESYFTPERDGDIDFLRVGLFEKPEDVSVDPAGNIYVIDAALDSLFQFNASGFITQAFGGPGVFLNPEGVAFFDKTLYIADTGNNRILRFKLSTDL